MKYFRNTELAKLYKVSEKSVRNWVQASLDGKLDLQLHTENSKNFIANTSKNIHAIELLVAKGKKYKNTRGFKAAVASQEFYAKYKVPEIYDIISSIDIHREIPHKYSYFGEGADYWDEYAKKMAQEQMPNILTSTIELLRESRPYLESILEDYGGVNVIDLGAGNAVPVKDFLGWLLDKGYLRRYVAIDTSPKMLDIAENNIKTWFGDKIPVEKHAKDINYDKFDGLILVDTFSANKKPILNIALLLGGTIQNLRDPVLPLRTIANSLGKEDLFILSRKLDSEAARRFFDFDVTHKVGKFEKERAILKLLGVDDDYYEMEQFFDEKKFRRVIQARFKVDVAITFQVEGKSRVIEINKGESVLVWHADHQTLLDTVKQYDENGLEVQQLVRAKDPQFLQIVAKIKNQRTVS